MASEHRSSRPYSGLRNCQQAFQEAVLRVGEQEVAHGGALRVSATEFLNEKFQISFGEDKETFAILVSELETAAHAHGISNDDLEIVVIASSTYWKITEKLFSASLDEFTALDDDGAEVLATHEGDLLLDGPVSVMADRDSRCRCEAGAPG